MYMYVYVIEVLCVVKVCVRTCVCVYILPLLRSNPCRVKQLYVAVQASLLVLTIPDTLEPLNEEHLSQVKELLCLLLQAAVAAYAVPVASLTKTAQPDNGEFGYRECSAVLFSLYV